MSRSDKPHQGAMANMFAVFGSGSVCFIDWLEAALELRRGVGWLFGVGVAPGVGA